MLQGTVIGNLGKDAEVKTIGERQYISFRMASTAKRKNEEKTTWVSVLYRYNENLLPFLKKGQQVFVQGDLDVSAYSNREQQAQADVSIFASQLLLVGQREGQQQAPQQQQPKAPQQTAEDNLPF